MSLFEITQPAEPRLPLVLSVLAFLPVLHNWRLWIYDHHVLHHPRTNGPHVDTFQPMCLRRYRAAPAWRRAWERFVRSPNPLAFAIYYIVVRWSQVKVVPTRSMPAQVRKAAWPHSALIAAYVGALVAGPALLRAGNTTAFLADVALLLVLPFFVFMTLLSTVLYIQHTHPQIPWFADGDAAIERFGQEALTVHVQVPRVLGALMHSSLEHAAHHVLPAIPCYRLRAAQARLTELLGGGSHDVPLAFGALVDIVRRCKLYDYERHHWVDFAGRTTAKTAAARPAYRAAPERQQKSRPQAAPTGSGLPGVSRRTARPT